MNKYMQSKQNISNSCCLLGWFEFLFEDLGKEAASSV